jgi:hypothetical protein
MEVRALFLPVALLGAGLLCLACPGDELCAAECPMPPRGCQYEGAAPSGACDEVTCGHLVCTQTNADEAESDAGEEP